MSGTLLVVNIGASSVGSGSGPRSFLVFLFFFHLLTPFPLLGPPPEGTSPSARNQRLLAATYVIPLATWKIDLIHCTIVHHGNWALRPKIQALKLYKKDFTFDIKDKLHRNFRFC